MIKWGFKGLNSGIGKFPYQYLLREESSVDTYIKMIAMFILKAEV